MESKNKFWTALGIQNPNKKAIEEISSKIEIAVSKLRYYNDNNILPDPQDLIKIEKVLSVSRYQLMISLEIYNSELTNLLRENIKDIKPLLTKLEKPSVPDKISPPPIFATKNGELYNDDCITVMKSLKSESVDLIFADPPFNLNKFYLSGINDSLTDNEYLRWCEMWIDECIRILKTGGTFYLWNLPKWNTFLSEYLNKRLSFKHWIATDIKYTLPIAGRLYPSHYSLLMYTKGPKANAFHPDRLPMEICKSCFKEIKDYGGYKDKMNPKGINLADVWYDIPPVRHKKYKAREEANELSIKLIDRVIEMSSNPGDIVFDPFGGSGTTYIVSELKQRKWIGVEIGPVEGILNRFDKIEDESKYLNQIRESYNRLFSDQVKKERKKRGHWTDDSFKNVSEQASLFNGSLRLV